MTSSERLLDLSREVCWRQWTALGVSGVRQPDSHSVVDLEALILFTGGLGDADPRLRDEATDWCVQFGPRFVSASRLRNLLAAEPSAARAPLLEFLATVNENSTSRWPLPDQASSRRVALSGKSRLPDPRKRPELLRLQLRALFGTTARAEVLLEFVGRSPELLLSASNLVATGYSKRNIAFVLADLALSGLLTERRVGNRIRYRLARRAELTSLAPGARTAILTRLDLRLRALAMARRLLHATASKSATIRSLEARRFAINLSATWDALDLAPPEPAEATAYHQDLTAWLAEQLISPQLR